MQAIQYDLNIPAPLGSTTEANRASIDLPTGAHHDMKLLLIMESNVPSVMDLILLWHAGALWLQALYTGHCPGTVHWTLDKQTINHS